MEDITKAVGMVNEIRNRIVDEESRVLFDARLQFMFDDDFYAFSKAMFSIERKWVIPYLDRWFDFENEYKNIALWGVERMVNM